MANDETPLPALIGFPPIAGRRILIPLSLFQKGSDRRTTRRPCILTTTTSTATPAT